MTFSDMLRVNLPNDEGRKKRLYTDSKGKVTIGIGRNLTDCGISDDEMALMFENDIKRAVAIAQSIVPSFDQLTEARKYVLCNMAFNLGPGLRAFEKMLAAVNSEDWERAADEMRDSKWDPEVGARADRLEALMREG